MKWKSEQCSHGGILEEQGKLFLRLECKNHCEDFPNGGCDIEKKFNISALKPGQAGGGAALNSLYYFSNGLIDYGDLEGFDSLGNKYHLQPERDEKDGKNYYVTDPDNWLGMLRDDRKLMFAIFANIDGDIGEQHRRIFENLKKDEWQELIGKDPAFYLDYREVKRRPTGLEELDWQTLCKKNCKNGHGELYAYLVNDHGYDFDDIELAELLAVKPDLDPAAYKKLKENVAKGLLKEKSGSDKTKRAGKMWLTLLLSGADVFWDDCKSSGGFDTLDGEQWMELMRSETVGKRAREKFNSNPRYALRFTDEDWNKIAKEKYYGKIKYRPNEYEYFRFAPRHVAKSQFKWLVGVSVATTVLGGIAMAAWGGILVCWQVSICLLLAGVIWSILQAKCFSFVAVRRKRTWLLHGPLVGIFCGVLLPLIALLLYSICEQKPAGVYYTLLFMAVFGGLFVVAAMISFSALRKKDNNTYRPDFSWLFYAIFVLMIVSGAFLWVTTSNQQLYKSCDKLDMQWREHFLKLFLDDENYWESWKNACKDGKSDELEDLLKKWLPQTGVTEYAEAREQLMDAVLREKGDFQRLAQKHNLVDNAAKAYIHKKLLDTAKNNSPAETIIGYMRVFKEYKIQMRDELRKALCDFAERRNDLGIAKRIWDQMNGADKKELGKTIAAMARKNDFHLAQSEENAKLLVEIASAVPEVFDKNFWYDLLAKLKRDRDQLHPRVCGYLEQKMPGYRDWLEERRKEFRDEVARGDIETFENYIRSPESDPKGFGNFLRSSKYVKIKGVGYENDYWFWHGYIAWTQKGSSPSADWEKCFNAFLRPADFKARNTQMYARRVRSEFADMLTKRENGSPKALQLWKLCLAYGPLTEEQMYKTYRKIFDCETNPEEFKKYFCSATSRVGLEKLFGNNIPQEIRKKIENIVPGTPEEKIEIAKYYLSVRNYVKARKLFDDEEVFRRLKSIVTDGETLYKLALVDSGLVNELKENVGRNKLHEVKKKFMSDMNDTHGGGKRSFEYVEKAAAGHYPEAMFILCVRYYYVSGEDPNQEERFKSELLRCKSDIKENHPDSEYLHYFDELSKAAGI